MLNKSYFLRIYISGVKKGQREPWAAMPGFSDTLRLTDNNTILVPYVVPRYGQTPAILDVLGEYPELRTMFGTVMK